LNIEHIILGFNPFEAKLVNEQIKEKEDHICHKYLAIETNYSFQMCLKTPCINTSPTDLISITSPTV
jgi:hypothetical protein